MSLNFLEIDLILRELSLQDAFIQDIIQPTFCSLVLKTYKKGEAKNIIISLESECTRINETFSRSPSLSPPARFMMLLRSRIKGSKIEKASQHESERIVIFSLIKGEERFLLIAKLWSASGNIFLCRTDMKIIDTLFRRPARKETAGETFLFPAPSCNTRKFTARNFDELAGYKTYNEKVESFYSSFSSSSLLEKLKKKIRAECENSLKKLRFTEEKLEKKKEEYERADEMRKTGELILAEQTKIKKGDKEAILLSFSGEKVKIKLERDKSAVENAAFYFEEYKKMKSGRGKIEDDIEVIKGKIERLEKLLENVLSERDPYKLQEIEKRREKKSEKTRAGLTFYVEGSCILVGRNAKESDELFRRNARGRDLWLHTRDYEGGFVFIKRSKAEEVSENVIKAAANLALYYSKARKNGKASLYMTEVKNLRRAKDAKAGKVIVTHEKNLFVSLDEALIKRLKLSLIS